MSRAIAVHTRLCLNVSMGYLVAQLALAANATVVDTGQAQCCSSIVPELPPATYYGATMYRESDPRSSWSPYLAIPDDATESVDELQKKLTTLELRGGPLNPVLVPTLGQLGAAYMGEKRYAEAIRYYRRGIHLARVNDGLNAASQVSMLEQMITALVRQENFAEADKQQAYLYRIKRWQKERGKPELLEATLRYADWMRGAYLGDLDDARYPRLVGLNDVYEDAMEEIESADGGDSPELLPYLQGRIELSYLISVYPGEQEAGFTGRATPAGQFQAADEAQLRFWRMRDHNFRYGLRALKRKEEIIRIEKGEATKESIDARIAIADWYQWHRRYAEAIRN
ncbi:MAG: hypothetical protein AAF098_09395, partial [Pseudomonadota bacterium]